MAKTYEVMDERMREFIASQPVYFVASAPEQGGHVNVSPKGYADTLTIIDETTVAYLDLDGSGVETISHIRENGRVTLLFCAFSGPPKIVRLYGRGRVVPPGEPEFAELIKRFGPHPGVRTIIVVECDRISDSCGYAVPFMEYKDDRGVLDEYGTRQIVRERRAARAANERVSIDGLPALAAGETDPVGLHS